MHNPSLRFAVGICVAVLATSFLTAYAQDTKAMSIPQSALIQPADFAKTLQGTGSKPVVMSVGPRMLFTQAHIPGAEWIGPASTPDGLQKLRARVTAIKKSNTVVLYCGCCPWEHCPNVAPAYAELKRLGFSSVKVLYIANNLGADWVYKGYPTAKGE
jgi:3-mercaptopyruvate sulfurtransferase SseA